MLNRDTLTRSTQVILIFSLMLFLASGCDKRLSGSAAENSENSRDKNAEFQRNKTKEANNPANDGDSRHSGRELRKTNVRVQPVGISSLTVHSTYVGHLLPNQRVLMRSEIDGVIEKVDFEEGEDVSKGRKLINVSTNELSLRLKIAQSDYKLAQTNLERDENLYSRNLIPGSRLDQTRTRADSAFLNQELARINFNKSVISSPLNGTVKTRHVKVGEFVRKGDKLVEILNIDRILVKVNIPEQEILSIQVGQNVEVALYIMEKKTFLGRVKNIGLEADSSNRTFPVEILVDNKERQLRAGMLARTTFTKNVDQDQIVIPRHTILERDQGRVVYVFEDGSEAVRCSRSDGIGLRKLDRLGVETIIISTEVNRVVAERAEKLKIRCVHGVEDKRAKLQSIADEHGFDLVDIAFVGNDVNDLGCLEVVGLPIAVQDAYPEVLRLAKYTTKTLGGYGAVREVCDLFETVRG